MLPLHSCALIMLLCFVNCPVLTPRTSLLHTGALSRSSLLCRSGTLSRILLLLIAHTGTLSRFVNFFFFSLWTGTLSRSSLPWRSGTLSRILLVVDPVRSHGSFFQIQILLPVHTHGACSHRLTRSVLLVHRCALTVSTRHSFLHCSLLGTLSRAFLFKSYRLR